MTRTDPRNDPRNDPRLTAASLTRFGTAVMAALGCQPAIAVEIAEHLVAGLFLERARSGEGVTYADFEQWLIRLGSASENP